MKSFSKKILILLVVIMSCGLKSGAASHQNIWENEENTKTNVAPSISYEKKDNNVDSDKLDGSKNVVTQKGHESPEPDLSVAKKKKDDHIWGCVAMCGGSIECTMACYIVQAINK